MRDLEDNLLIVFRLSSEVDLSSLSKVYEYSRFNRAGEQDWVECNVVNLENSTVKEDDEKVPRESQFKTFRMVEMVERSNAL
jgi:hypothetical protein